MCERVLEKTIKNHWDSMWMRTARNGFSSPFLNYFSKLGTEACWKMYSDLLNLCTFNSNPRILELGAGSGSMTLRILKKIKGTATLVDYSRNALYVAKKNALKEGLADKISFIQDDVFNFIPKGKYDLVHSGGLIEHFPIPLICELVKKHAAHVKVNGYIILMTPAPVWWYKATRKFLEGVRWWPQDFETAFNKKMLEHLVETNNLNVLKSIQSNGIARASAILAKLQVID